MQWIDVGQNRWDGDGRLGHYSIEKMYGEWRVYFKPFGSSRGMYYVGHARTPKAAKLVARQIDSKSAPPPRSHRNPTKRKAKENPSTTTWLVLGGGLAVVGVAAYFLLKPTTSAASTTATSAAPQLPPGLPASANLQAAAFATNLLRLNGPAEANPARQWLEVFQSSVGLNPSGQLDQTTRAMLVRAVPDAANIPTPSLLG